MGIKLQRKKRRNYKLSLAYKLSRLMPLSHEIKLKLYLDMAWIFARLAHETTFKSKIKVEYEPESDFLFQKIKENNAILDVGCGKGYVVDRLLPKTSNIVAIDYDMEAVDKAKARIPNVDFRCVDVFDYLHTIDSKQFDVIVLSHVLEHLDDPDRFLKKISKYSRYVYIEVPDFESTHLNLFRNKVGSDLIYTDADHVSEFDREELQTLIANSNLIVVDAEFRHGVMKYWCESILKPN